LDTLLAAEAEGQIDHQGICDEVNTFMFEGYCLAWEEICVRSCREIVINLEWSCGEIKRS